MTYVRLLCISSILLYTLVSQAGEPSSTTGGQVQISLDGYQRLVQAGTSRETAPARSTVGTAQLQVDVTEREGLARAEVSARLSIEVFEDGWSLVPVLPATTAIDRASLQGEPVQLVQGNDGLSVVARSAGKYSLVLRYRVDARSVTSTDGFVLSLPTPRAAATEMSVSFPGEAFDIAILPAVAVEIQTGPGTTRAQASLPSTQGVQVSWRRAAIRPFTISRARYRGTLEGAAVVWKARLLVDCTLESTQFLPILPASAALRDVRVDGKQASVRSREGFFDTDVTGRGRHEIDLEFEVPVGGDAGPPAVDLRLVPVPISELVLELPGEKRVSATPSTQVSHEFSNGSTLAEFHVRLGDRVRLQWTEAVPGAASDEPRVSAELAHVAHVEDEVLYVQATVTLDLRRGALSEIELPLPEGVSVNTVEATHSLADWRVRESGQGGRMLVVYLDHPVERELGLRVGYDRSLRQAAGSLETFPIPLLRVESAQRSRGVIALLATRESALTPVSESGLTRVGESQIPTAVRERITQKVVHTYKYAEESPTLQARVSVPERVREKLDARVDTLISLGEVTLRGQATIDLRIKSGAIDAFAFTLPASVNVLGLTSPSLRSYRVENQGAESRLAVVGELTQPLDGDVRIELSYESLHGDEEELSVPILAVPDAEVQQGHLAIEARSAVEIGIRRAERLSPMDPADLARPLLLRTENPVLRAYEYVVEDALPELVLTSTRHRRIEVQTAMIPRAEYTTLVASNGLAVTRAKFVVRNVRQQFVRLRLPVGSEIWSVQVAGRAEKPAVAEAGTPPKGREGATAGEDSGTGQAKDPRPEVLIQARSAADGFPVEVTFATELPAFGSYGRLHLELPEPDLVVTQSSWSVYLPPQLRYGEPVSSLQRVVSSSATADHERELDVPAERAAIGQVPPELEIQVPKRGTQFGFEQIYVNRSSSRAFVEIRYASTGAIRWGAALLAFGCAGIGLAALLAWRERRRGGVISPGE